MDVLSKIAFARVGSCLVYVSADAAPPSDEFAAYLAFVKPLREQIECALVLENGPGPSAAQRRALLEVVGKKETRTAVLARSVIARGALTAMSWFNGSFRAFHPEEMTAALGWLALEPRTASEVRTTAEALRARLLP